MSKDTELTATESTAAETKLTTTATELTAAALPSGFAWGAVRAGIKASGKTDLAAAVVLKNKAGAPTAGGVAVAAAMYTSNRVVAAPVTVGRQHLLTTGGRVAAVLVNAGNANCATGAPGIAGCKSTCVAAAESFGCIFDEVFPSSTGIIGVPFPAEKVVAAMPELKASLGSSAENAESFARAIMTTDTRVKMAYATVAAGEADPAQNGLQVKIWGAAKGAGMIHPRLGEPVGPPHATMLVYLFTDVAASAEDLNAALRAAVQPSFNSISIDGDTSTNDTVLLLASGASGATLSKALAPAFETALGEVCRSLARQIVDDGEGVGHVVTLDIQGAATDDDARLVAKAIAHSPLCKTAWSSADPNWGRLLAAAGYSGANFEMEKTRIRIGDQEVFEYGVRAASFDEAKAHAAMMEREYTIRIDLGAGAGECKFLTCDLTAEYVSINADYST
ncbi:MAG: bifunctional glutamate N-acetyltransferase/amino-acid acetyltransferase ArgJ [Acidobacteriaceae bacterium]|nr:bifunctional glutamate N-acetyltransferase/amino-acid acetyltransferase ArgJ [Acidobacteriaceae bacterium]